MIIPTLTTAVYGGHPHAEEQRDLSRRHHRLGPVRAGAGRLPHGGGRCNMGCIPKGGAHAKKRRTLNLHNIYIHTYIHTFEGPGAWGKELKCWAG